MGAKDVGWVAVVSVAEQSYEPDDIGWACYDCDNTKNFTRHHNALCGSFCDCDVECLECGSTNTGEEVLTYEENENFRVKPSP